MRELISKLCSLDGVAGYEKPVRDFIKSIAEKYASEITVDPVGNLFCFKKGSEAPKAPVMLGAHTDEVGFLIKSVTADGMIKLDPVGSIDPRVLIGRRMKVGKAGLPGVISIKAIHLTTADERKKAPELKTLYVDIGAKSREEALSHVSIGEPVVFDSPFTMIGVNCVKGKALDDRIGCAVLLKLMEEDLPFDTWFLFSASEEIGARGAINAFHRVDPAFFAIVECTAAGDVPDVPEHLWSTRLRGGAAVSLIDDGAVYCRGLRERITAKATEQGVLWQYRLRKAGSNDASAYIHGTGAHVFGISVPARYIHCANSVAYMPDAESALSHARIFIEEAGAYDD
ncbi:MAG: M42 family peptidase [Clostridia bacterium]|nr:M42 family peptidase [Clostridia bacterium]